MDVGTQVSASDLPICDVLESGPPLGAEKSFVLEPIRNRLLRNSRTIQEVAKARSESGLAARNVDGALERSNVRFIHGGSGYTSMLVKVNKHARVTAHKAPCTVIRMRARQQKIEVDAGKPSVKKAAKRSRRKPLMVWDDGRTANQRLQTVLDREDITQSKLIELCNVVMGWAKDRDPPIVSQAVLSNLQRNIDDLASSRFVTVIAEAIGVRPMWLQYAKGPEKDARTVSDATIEAAKKLIATLGNPPLK